jgi:glycosyltransferase involved in cell wall biosynthesis
MYDALILTLDDNANTAWRFSQCLKKLGLRVLAFKGEPHPYSYPDQLPLHRTLMGLWDLDNPSLWWDVPDMAGFFHHAKVIHFIHSFWFDPMFKLKEAGKKIVMQHGGRNYRYNYKALNEVYNPIVDATIIQMPDLWELGATKKHLIYYPVQTDKLEPNYNRLNPDKMLIGHWPSSEVNKGTNVIVGTIKKLQEDPQYKDKFEYVGVHSHSEHDYLKGTMVWEEHIRRMGQCDILIETCQATVDQGETFDYGEWGNTAIEAAALGNVVITNHRRRDIYEEHYGHCALNIANNAEELEREIKRVLDMTDEELIHEKMRMRSWVVANHSMEATAERLWAKVYQNLI